MRTLPRSGLTTAMALLTLALASTGLQAQEKAKDEAACSAHVMPLSVPTGNAAARLTVVLSQPIGAVTRFTPDENSGITLAKPKDLPRTDMANESATPKPIDMANDTQGRVTLWINTDNAKAGSYGFSLSGASGSCSGTLKISEHR